MKRVHSYGQYCYIPGFVKAFPELSHLTTEEMRDRWRKIKVDLYQEKQEPVEKWIRITLPFGVIVLTLMVFSIPFKFMITGEWGYNTRKGKMYNWLRKLGILYCCSGSYSC